MQSLELTEVMLPHERYLCQVCNRVRDPETELSKQQKVSRRNNRKYDVLDRPNLRVSVILRHWDH